MMYILQIMDTIINWALVVMISLVIIGLVLYSLFVIIGIVDLLIKIYKLNKDD